MVSINVGFIVESGVSSWFSKTAKKLPIIAVNILHGGLKHKKSAWRVKIYTVSINLLHAN
jgi:hypothetical protein